ncbi:hypothetical protein [Streptomyces canus]|uniref:hypothetical protein n=1 Tax=Streptomyces canus TaxID=58343 RepID=UPI0033A12C46
MDGQSDDDYMISGRDRNSFFLEIKSATSKKRVAEVIEWFETTEKYFAENFPDLAKEVADLPDEPPTPG